MQFREVPLSPTMAARIAETIEARRRAGAVGQSATTPAPARTAAAAAAAQPDQARRARLAAAFAADVERRTAEVSAIAAACQAAGLPGLADQFVADGLDLAAVSKALAGIGWDAAFARVHQQRAAATDATAGDATDAAAVDGWATAFDRARAGAA
jgi:hypothetical protein